MSKMACANQKTCPRAFFQVIDKNGQLGRKVLIRPETVTISRNFKCDVIEFGIDWAIAKLQSPIDEIDPFIPMDVSSFAGGLGFRPLIGSRIYSLAARGGNLESYPGDTPTICLDTLGYAWPLRVSTGDLSYG